MQKKLEPEEGQLAVMLERIILIIVCLVLFRYLGDCLHEHTNCYTLEVSFFCYTDKETGNYVPYTEDGCKWQVMLILNLLLIFYRFRIGT